MDKEVNVKELNIFQRMSAVTNELGRVAKNLQVQVSAKNTYKAVSEADILDAVKPVEEKFGVYSYPVERKIIENGTMESETQYGTRKQLYMRLEITYRFVNIDNPTEFIDLVSYGDGIDTGDKAPGKAMTYADKYALMKAYKISTGDDPDQNASEPLKGVSTGKNTNKNEPSKAEQQQAEQAASAHIDETKFKLLQNELDRTGYNATSICKGYKVNSLKELNVVQWSDAMTKLKTVKTKPATDLGLE